MGGIRSSRRGCIWADRRGGVPYDHFNRSDTTNALGLAENKRTWGDTVGNGLRVFGNKCAQPVAGSGGQFLEIGSRLQEFTFIVEDYWPTQVYFRAVDVDNCFRLDMGTSSGSSWLYARSGGTDRLIGQLSNQNVHGATTYHITVTDDRISIAWGGRTRLCRPDAALSTINGTKVGFDIAHATTRIDDFQPADWTRPRNLRTFPGSASLSVLFDPPRNYPEITDYRVTVAGTDHDITGTSCTISGLTDWATPDVTVKAKIGGSYGSASDIYPSCVGWAAPPTLTSITPLGGGRATFAYSLGAAHAFDYNNNSDSLLVFFNSATPGGLATYLASVEGTYSHPTSYTGSSIPTGTQYFRMYVDAKWHTPPSTEPLVTPWFGPVTIT